MLSVVIADNLLTTVFMGGNSTGGPARSFWPEICFRDVRLVETIKLFAPTVLFGCMIGASSVIVMLAAGGSRARADHACRHFA